jgi:GDP/UDP-N,N'-diacetylbacillosamine 2-epimerase (hydrolysing)
MKTVAIFSSTRGDMSILSPLIKKINQEKKVKYLFFVGGTHLIKYYGKTVDEIKDLKINIKAKFDYLVPGNKNKNFIESLSRAEKSISKIFSKYNFDFVCILGDRFEKLAIVNNAIIYNKPIMHLHGGEITEGVIDNQIRNMITKASHLHFVICENYKNNIIKMGENKKRVFNFGSLAVENMKNIKKIPKKKLFHNLGLNINIPTILLTYHPVTLEKKISGLKQIKNIFKAIDNFNFQTLITAPGHEVGRSEIENFIKQKVKKNKKFVYIRSLGYKKLFNLMPHCKFVIGNSSSGIIEAPFLRVPTINIGDRQKGRFMHASVLNSNYEYNKIKKSIEKIFSTSFKKRLKKFKYLFGNGNSSKKIIEKIIKTKIDQNFLRKK